MKMKRTTMTRKPRTKMLGSTFVVAREYVWSHLSSCLSRLLGKIVQLFSFRIQIDFCVISQCVHDFAYVPEIENAGRI